MLLIGKLYAETRSFEVWGLVDWWIKIGVLFAKWVLRFGTEENALWRRVICARYGISCSSLLCDWKCINNANVFVKAIASLFEVTSPTGKVFTDGLKVVIGNGGRAIFWDTSGGDSVHLKLACPRIFALTVNKKWVVQDYGSWRSIKDSLAWAFSHDGKFSMGSFRLCLEESGLTSLLDHKFIWKKICPPKIQIFIWQALRGWLMVRQILQKFGVGLVTSMACHLCNSEGWQGLCSEDKNSRAWNTLFVALLWSIWESRNQKVFKGFLNSNSTEILAIQRAVILSVSVISFVGKEIDVVSDSKDVVAWINSEGFSSLNRVKLIYDNRTGLNMLGNTRVIHNPRFSNFFVDALAKKGSGSGGKSLIWDF
ncbi:hypothetical protein Dsin_008966 [Dipteronia sinensis]|uniref:Reverse transcriptase zinc-binding domain-containing protein n=1 Tax=Dipteronia sinensis TaxID=43782 RepID=A0AAE0APP4_9ROSI|nr:hypothetical protein Dsin_008966 [Dipteronia sinensis]